MCGGDIALSVDKTFGTCEYCGCSMTLPRIDDERRAAAFNRGNHFRRIGEFDKALAVYERIVQENEQDAEAHWCCALCRFGIEYVEDPVTLEWLPTCHRASFDSFLEDVDYKAALEYSDGLTRRQYMKDALKIAEVQKGILATSRNTENYDIFICYKETDESGNRTRDSLLAQEIYYQFIEQGRRVFFSRITLEDVAGTQYEPYIFAALNSARVMIVVGTRAEHLNTVWVKNEWGRFLAMMKKDRSKLLLPCFRDMDPYDLPEQLSVLQSYDMSRIGFLQDLTRGIAKVLDADKPLHKETVVLQQAAANGSALLKRAFLFLEDRDWKTADEYCEKVLDMDPENGEAYLCKLLAEYKAPGAEELGKIGTGFSGSANYQKAMRFGGRGVREKLENAGKDAVYFAANHLLRERLEGEDRKKSLLQVISDLETVSGWRDSPALIRNCREEITRIEVREEEARLLQQRQAEQRRLEAEKKREAEEKKRLEAQKQARKNKKVAAVIASLTAVAAALLILVNAVVLPMLHGNKAEENIGTAVKPSVEEESLAPAETMPADPRAEAYVEAESLLASGETAKAAIAFGKLGDYEDARQRSLALWEQLPYPRETISAGDTGDIAHWFSDWKDIKVPTT